MRSEDELVALANENFVASFRKLAEHTPTGEVRERRGVFAFVSGLPLSLFNGCVVVERARPDDLDAGLSWVAARRVPHRLFVAAELEAEVAYAEAAHGLERDPVPYPGMVLSPIPVPPELPGDVRVVPCRRSRVATSSSGSARRPVSRASLAETLFSRSFLADVDVQAFVGRLDGQPVGYSLAIRSAGATGVYNVGTLPAARRRGVGTALTWAAVASGQAAGFDCAVLQSSEMAVSMYEAMGFRTVAPYIVFGRSSRRRSARRGDARVADRAQDAGAAEAAVAVRVPHRLYPPRSCCSLRSRWPSPAEPRTNAHERGGLRAIRLATKNPDLLTRCSFA